MKVADGRYGYMLKPGFHSGLVSINAAGFHQRQEVPIARTPNRLRVVCLGESTTFGNHVDSNYPSFLRTILADYATPAEVINAGVPGWVSDQVALRAEHQLAAYSPDVVILYVGWNDFQSYDPLGPEPAVSYWEFAYKGNSWKQETAGWLKSVALLSAASYRNDSSATSIPTAQGTNGSNGYYRFLFRNLDRIVRAFRDRNPDVKVFVSTLVGRWPVGTAEDWKRIPPVWWMTKHNVSVDAAASYARTLNDQIRSYARERNVYLIDDAAAFERLDRARLQVDWAHMISDGYELLAWTMFEAMVRERVVTVSRPVERANALRAQYALTPSAESNEGAVSQAARR